MKTDKHINGDWATLNHRTFGTYTGYIRKRKNRWWFCGDICREVKIRLAGAELDGWTLDKHKLDEAE